MLITLKTERLFLRPLSIDDLYSTHAYASNPMNTKYMLYLPNGTLEETKEFLSAASSEWEKENPDFYEFAITLDNRHIGAISLYLNKSHSEGELGWILHKDFWGHGYAAEAAFAVKRFSADKLRVEKLVARCDSQNAESYRLMKRIGMTLERDDVVRYNKNAKEPTKELKYSLVIGR